MAGEGNFLKVDVHISSEQRGRDRVSVKRLAPVEGRGDILLTLSSFPRMYRLKDPPSCASYVAHALLDGKTHKDRL